MYKYTVNVGEECEIKTPFCTDFSEIRQEQILQTSEVIKRKSIYPNGFEITFSQYADHIEYETNRPLIKQDDGSYIVEL